MADATSGANRFGRRWWAIGVGTVAAVVALSLIGPAPAHAASASGPARSGLVPATPCAVGTAACVALGSEGYDGKAWLIQDGQVARGPVDVLTGGPGEDTPTGTFHVISKDINHTSTETTNAEGQPSPMPYSVFFTASGDAFHGGGAGKRTAGCVRLPDEDARYFFEHLDIGDTVQVVDGAADYQEPQDDDNQPEHHDGGARGLLGF